MAPTAEQIREQYLANQIFLIGEKLGSDLEVIDRRANYIVVVDGTGETKKMFLDEAYDIRLSENYSDPTGKTHTQLEAELHQVYKNYPEYHENGYHAMVDKFAADPFYNLHKVAKEYLKSPVEYRMSPSDLKEGRVKFSSFASRLTEGFSYKGYKPRHFQNHPEAQAILEKLAVGHPDPYGVLSAIKQLDIFFEKLDATSLERAQAAIAKIDSIENHSYLNESAIEEPEEVRAAREDPARDSEDEDEREAAEVRFRTASMRWQSPEYFKLKESMDTIKDEEIDFTIEEKLTYLNFKMVLTENFENHVHKVMDHLEKNPKELDELADHIKTIEHIAHHYDTHSVHMKEGFFGGDDEETQDLKRNLDGIAARKEEQNTGVAYPKVDDIPKIVQKTFKSASYYGGKYPVRTGELRDHLDKGNHFWGRSGQPVRRALYGALDHFGKGTKITPEQFTSKAMELHVPLGSVNESNEDKAIEHAEPANRISVRKLSSGPQMVKIAKRAAVELLAQKLANKPIKKISSKEKDVIVKAIKNKKTVVMKLARKLIPRIKRIEHENFTHEEFGSAE